MTENEIRVSHGLYGDLIPNKRYYVYKVTTETGCEDILVTTTPRHKPGECPPGLSYRGTVFTDSDGRIRPVGNERDRFWSKLRSIFRPKKV